MECTPSNCRPAEENDVKAHKSRSQETSIHLFEANIENYSKFRTSFMEQRLANGLNNMCHI